MTQDLHRAYVLQWSQNEGIILPKDGRQCVLCCDEWGKSRGRDTIKGFREHRAQLLSANTSIPTPSHTLKVHMTVKVIGYYMYANITDQIYSQDIYPSSFNLISNQIRRHTFNHKESPVSIITFLLNAAWPKTFCTNLTIFSLLSRKNPLKAFY